VKDFKAQRTSSKGGGEGGRRGEKGLLVMYPVYGCKRRGRGKHGELCAATNFSSKEKKENNTRVGTRLRSSSGGERERGPGKLQNFERQERGDPKKNKKIHLALAHDYLQHVKEGGKGENLRT